MPQATNHPTLNSNIKTKFAKNENEVSFGSEIASKCEKAIDTYRGCIFLIFSFHKLFSWNIFEFFHFFFLQIFSS